MSRRRAPLTRRHQAGPHTADLVARRVGMQLAQLREEKGGLLDPADYAPFEELTQRTRRQLQRYAAAHERRRAVDLLTTAAGADEPRSVLMAARRAAAGQRARYEVDEHDMEVIAGAPNRYEAWLFLRYQDKQSNVYLRQVSKSTFYEAYARLPRSVQVGLLKGSQTMKGVEPHLPRVFTRLGQSLSYDLKNLRINVIVDEVTGLLSDDNWLLSFREEWSGVVVGRLVLDHSPTDAEVAALLAETVRGWTYDDVFVGGAPDLVHPDNEAKLNGPKMRQAQSLLGTLISSSESFESEANGGQERFHADIDKGVSTLPGRTRGPRRRGGKTYVPDGDVAYLTFEQLRERVYDLVDEYNFDERPSVARYDGRTRFEFYRDMTADGQTVLRPVDDESLAPLGLPLPRRKLDANAGTLRWDNGFYFCDAVAARGDTHYVATALPNDPTVVFLFDDEDRFVGTAVRVEELSDRVRARTVIDRKARERGVDAKLAEAERRLRAGTWADAFRDYTGDTGDAAPGTDAGAEADAPPAPEPPDTAASGAGATEVSPPSGRGKRRPTGVKAGRKPAGVGDSPDVFDEPDDPAVPPPAKTDVGPRRASKRTRSATDLDDATEAALRRNGVA